MRAGVERLRELCRQVRRDILIILNEAGSGHTGGSLSACEMVVTLYFGRMRHDPKNPRWEDRDRFVLSKGHAAPLLYTVLAHAGYLEPGELSTLRKTGSRLQGHVEMNLDIGVEASTGSLGHGLSIGNGLALAARLKGKSWRVYVLVGDGDIQEGQFWEAAMTSSHRRLDNLCLLVDNNNLQQTGRSSEIKSSIYPIADKLRAFGWHAVEIDGHDLGQISDALDMAEAVKGKPTAIVARTIKGKGVSIFEDNVDYHGICPSDKDMAVALKELRVDREELIGALRRLGFSEEQIGVKLKKWGDGGGRG